MLDEADFEKFIIKVDELLTDPVRGVDIASVGKALAMDPAQAREYATYLHQEEWARVDSGRLWLTVKGRKAIAMLRRPKWRRWIDENRRTIMLVLVIVTGLMYAFISGVLVYLLQ